MFSDSLWLEERLKGLSKEVKANFDTLWVEVEKYGLQIEVTSSTRFAYEQDEQLEDKEDQFMRAFHYGMNEWDL